MDARRVKKKVWPPLQRMHWMQLGWRHGRSVRGDRVTLGLNDRVWVPAQRSLAVRSRRFSGAKRSRRSIPSQSKELDRLSDHFMRTIQQISLSLNDIAELQFS